MATKYEPIAQTRFGGGMATVGEANRIRDDQCVYAQNIEIGSDGGYGPRKGCSLFGNRTAASTGKGLGSHTCKLRDGSEIPLRQRVITASTKSIIEWYNVTADAWELLVDSWSQTARICFNQWNTSSADRVYFGNGVQNYSKWTCIISTVVSNTAIALTLADGTNFPSSGTVVVDGTQYAYSGKSGNQLTGLVGLPAFTVGEGVAIVADTSSLSSVVKSNIMFAHVSRMYIQSGSSFVYSKTGNPEDFAYSTPRIPGDGGIEDFPEGGGKINGFAGRDEVLLPLKRDILRTFQWDQRDISTNEIPLSKPLGFSPEIGPEHSFSVASFLKEVFYVSKKWGLRQVTQVLQSTQEPTQALDILDINDPIAPTIRSFDFSQAVTIVHDKKVLVACMSEEDIAGNDTVIVYDLRTKGIILYKGWQVNSWFIYLGELYYNSSTQPNCFKAFDGYTDDGGPITSIFRSKQWDFTQPAVRKEIPLLFIEGSIGDGTDIEVTLNTDSHRVTRTIDSDGSYVIETPDNTLGIYELGSQPIAGLIDAVDELKKFRVYVTNSLKRHFLFDVFIKCTSLGGRYKIQTLAPNPVLEKEPPANLKLST